MDEIDEGGGVIKEAKYQKYPTECIIIQCKKYWQVLMFNTFNIAFRKTKPRSIFLSSLKNARGYFEAQSIV